jgi:hypothetical protein
VFWHVVILSLIGFGEFWYASVMSEGLYRGLRSVKSCGICLNKTYCILVQHNDKRRRLK